MTHFFLMKGNRSQEKNVDLKRDYSEKGLQVIVKLANIHLLPEKRHSKVFMACRRSTGRV